MIFGSFPQLILGIFIMQGLQIQEPLNILSTVSSFACVIFALGEFLVCNEDSPFVYTILGMMSTFIDTSLRALFIAYMASIIKSYSLIIPVTYFFLMLIAICIKKRKCSLNLIDLFNAAYSFPCSALEYGNIEYSFRYVC